ncbi:DUF4256 domain-containing protein [Rheinheimera sp. MM224]|uniref:DUF4256 domain-containing protein n=1 Tax=Rheinheimera sp. MM224 TaxID=3019969 RepID=UPI0021F8F470|nr:DUF4256 domain-containing protein [Rheinheimera sp. MM224]CAI3799846.1 hypothetical protein JAMGFMIE_02432 [Rheinheimera sp. MM224]
MDTRHSELIQLLKKRFEKNKNRHVTLDWVTVQERLEAYPDKLTSLFEMEASGGEPDVVGVDEQSGEFIFFDCSAESPKGRRSLCYDREALDARKEHKPASSAVEMAAAMGIQLLNEDDYRYLQQFGSFDSKTSSWLATPGDIRALDGAIFGDYRYGRVFIYHNGAQSYYAVRGFRGSLRV